MAPAKTRIAPISKSDLDFLIETVSPEVRDKYRLKEVIEEDEDFRKSYVGSDKVFRRVMEDEKVFLRISPRLFFEILLRKASVDLDRTSYTVEKTRTMKIAIFDTKEVVGLLNRESLLHYLADMLASFTKIESYSMSFRVRKGMWKKIRFNDLDIESLMSMSQVVDAPYRLGFYKRIADICLFILGIFPEFAEREFRYPSGQVRPRIAGRARISPEEYEREGRRFYRLAAEHDYAREQALSDVFMALHDHFEKAKKPLTFIASHYLEHKGPIFL